LQTPWHTPVWNAASREGKPGNDGNGGLEQAFCTNPTLKKCEKILQMALGASSPASTRFARLSEAAPFPLFKWIINQSIKVQALQPKNGTHYSSTLPA
jgi:hypothetical protein